MKFHNLFVYKIMYGCDLIPKEVLTTDHTRFQYITITTNCGYAQYDE